MSHVPGIACSHFLRFGKCKFGDGCKWKHDLEARQKFLDRNEVTVDSFALRSKETAKLIKSAKLTGGTSDALWWNHKDGANDIDSVSLRAITHDCCGDYGFNMANNARRRDNLHRFLWGAANLLMVGNVTPIIDMGNNPDAILIVGSYLEGSFTIDPRVVSSYPVRKSFQMMMVPFVIVLTTASAMTSYSSNTTSVYGAVFHYFPQFSVEYIRCLKKLIDLGRLFPVGFDPFVHAQRNKLAFLPICFVQVIMPIVLLLRTLCSRFGLSHESIQTTALELESLVEKWREKLEAKALNTGHPDLESCFVHQIVSRELWRVLSVIRRTDHSETKDEFVDCVDAYLWRAHTLIPPGSRSSHEPDTPRHDNDFLNISDIRIVPTQSELLCETPPAIPGNFLYTAEAHWLPPGPPRHIDTHFRLLREDFLFEMRGSLQCLLKFLDARRYDDPLLETRRIRQRNCDVDVDLFVYSNICVFLLRDTTRRGVGFVVDFAEPSFLENYTLTERKSYWENSPKLKCGNMGLLLLKPRRGHGNPEMVVGTIQDRDVDSLVNDTKRCKFTFVPDETCNAWILLRSQDQLRSSFLMYFIESPLLFQGYRPFLKVLKEMNPLELPFHELICPSQSPKSTPTVQSPLYSIAPSHAFDLSFLLKEDCGVEEFLLKVNENDDTTRRLLLENSTLDDDQADALLAALTSRVCCIQGPPGTGKTFIGTRILQAIVSSTSQEYLKPILVVCFTNHALDQFLWSLIEAGTTSIQRLGKPKDERLLPYCVLPSRGMGVPFIAIENVKEESKSCVDEFFKTIAWRRDLTEQVRDCLIDELQENSPFEPDCRDEVIDYWLRGGYSLYLSHPESLWSMSEETRIEHFEVLVNQSNEDRLKQGGKMMTKIRDLHEQIQHLYYSGESATLHGNLIIGATTNGISSHIDSLMALSPKVVIIEEAAEVLEAHVLSCLLPSVQHLIMIGDHQQLRPKVATYELTTESREGKKFRLDMSMFERLQEGKFKFPISKIGKQRRMRPEISRIVRDLSYPHLIDDPSVMDRPNIKGVRMNVVFFTHESPEKGSEGDAALHEKSRSNVFEAEMVDKFVQFLLFQGYAPNQIVVLTPYLGQLAQIRAVLSKTLPVVLANQDEKDVDKLLGGDTQSFTLSSAPNSFTPPKVKAVKIKNLAQCIRVSTIDNYQGEENDIVIISMVRNRRLNTEGSIGFLRVENRINVLLSRARCGMFIFGNAELLKSKSPLWQQVLDGLENEGNVLTHLPLFCQRHPEYEKFVTLPTDFTLFFPQGGCLQPCEFRLQCGHRCYRLCHSDRLDHRDLFCNQQCTRLHKPCNHLCPELCGSECGDCKNVVAITLPCGHPGTHPCYIAQKPLLIRCPVPTTASLDCGHSGTHPCYIAQKPLLIRCEVPTTAVLDCGHSGTHPCYIAQKPLLIRCQVRTTVSLDCGHSSTRPCHIAQQPLGIRCDARTTINLPCGHDHQILCHVARGQSTAVIPPPPVKCTVLVSITIPVCGHIETVPCYDRSSAHPCEKICNMPLECGHVCKARCADCTDLAVLGLGDKTAPDNLRSSELMKHVQCFRNCGRAMLCNHNCGVKCHHGGVCPPCQRLCDAPTCSHSKCPLKCCEPCQGCAELCDWSCEHFGKCTLPCVTPCVRPPCDKRCSKLLKCGHRCPSVCGEICPTQDFCQECGLGKHRGAVVDIFCGTSFSEIILDDNPIVFLSCAHFFTMESMDGLMELDKFYCAMPDGSRKPRFPRCDENLTTRRCPTCKTPIMTVMRYGRVTKKVALNAVDTQFTKVVETKFAALESDFVKFLPTVTTHQMDKKTRMQLAFLRSQIKNFLSNLSKIVSMKPYLPLLNAQVGVLDVLALQSQPQSYNFYKCKGDLLLLMVTGVLINDHVNHFGDTHLAQLAHEVNASLSLADCTCRGLAMQWMNASLSLCKHLKIFYLMTQVGLQKISSTISWEERCENFNLILSELEVLVEMRPRTKGIALLIRKTIEWSEGKLTTGVASKVSNVWLEFAHTLLMSMSCKGTRRLISCCLVGHTCAVRDPPGECDECEQT